MVAASADNADPVSLNLNVPPVVVSWMVLLTPPVLTLAILKITPFLPLSQFS